MNKRAIFRIICFLMASIAITFLVAAIAIHCVPEYRIYNAIFPARMVAPFFVALYLGIVWIIHMPYFGYFAYKGTFPIYGSCAWVFLTLVITLIIFGSIRDPLTTLLTIFATMQSVLFAVISLLVSRLWRKDVHGKA